VRTGIRLRRANNLNVLPKRYPKDPLVGLHLDRLRQGASDEEIIMTTK